MCKWTHWVEKNEFLIEFVSVFTVYNMYIYAYELIDDHSNKN